MNTIQNKLYTSIQANRDRKALIDSGDGSVITYGELYEKAARAAGYLQDKGLRAGDFLVIALSKSVPYIIAETASFLFGFGAVLMDVNYPEARSAYAARDAGAKIITDFFKQQLQQFMTDELDPLGRQIIELVMNDAPLEDYLALTPMNLR